MWNNIIKFGESYIAIHYCLISVLAILLLLIVIHKVMMSNHAPKTLTDIRKKALRDKNLESSAPTGDLWREIREMRVKIEILTDEIRSLRRDLKGPPAYAQEITASSRRALAPPSMPNTSYAILSADYE